MESRRKRSRSQIIKWVCYTLLMLLCTVLQTTPGLFQLGDAKPLWLLPLALAVAVEEDEFAGGIIPHQAARWGCWPLSCWCSAFCSRRWCSFTSKPPPRTSSCWRWGQVCWCSRWTGCSSTTCPATAAVLTIPVCALVFGCVRRIHAEFKIDNGIV